MTTKTLKWRLDSRPTVEELLQLVDKEIITKEEAKQILITESDRDTKSYQDEIKFLRELVEKLSNNQHSKIVEIIREVDRPYAKRPWWQPYDVWCAATNDSGKLGAHNYLVSDADGQYLSKAQAMVSFKDINSFN